MEKILLDTNFLISCVKQKIDFISEFEKLFGICEIIIPEQVLSELDKLIYSKKSKRADKQASFVVKEMLRILKFKTIDLKEKDVDMGIINIARKNKYVVATIDKKLKKRLKQQKTKLVIIRKKNHLMLESSSYF